MRTNAIDEFWKQRTEKYRQKFAHQQETKIQKSLSFEEPEFPTFATSVETKKVKK